MTTEHSVVPYATLGDLPLSVLALTDAVTGAALPVTRNDNPEFGTRFIDASEAGEWSKMRITFMSTVTDDQLRAALATDETIESVCLCAMVTCGPAKLRWGSLLARNSDGEWHGVVDLFRDDVRGSVELTLKALRTADEQSGATDGIARSSGAILGTAIPIVLALDHEAVPYNGPIQFSWKDFATDDIMELRTHAALPMYVDTSTVPRVYLNTAISDFQAALQGGSTGAAAGALRHSLATYVGGAVWRQLVAASIGCLPSIDPESPEDEFAVPTDWRGTVASSFARFIDGEAPVEKTLRQVRTDWDDPDAVQNVLTRITLFADREARCRNYIDRAIKMAQRDEQV